MRRARDTKAEIFLAAVELIAEKGFKEVSMREIACQTGIKPASIYNHFASKELILDALLEQYLERMERFYEKFHETCSHISSNSKLEDILQQLMLTYEPEERHLMYQLTRIVHHEQFHSYVAADALIGSGYRKYMEEHVYFFDCLSKAGLIQGNERNRYYGELFARMSLTFATQFLHPEIEPTLQDQSDLFRFLIPMIVHYEQHLQNP